MTFATNDRHSTNVDSDEQIIEACLRAKDEPVIGSNVGDDPWRKLCDRHFATVHGLATRMTGDKCTADDLAQETFLKVFRSLEQFQHKSKFSTWLYRITMNTIFTHLNVQKGSRTVGAELSETVDSKQTSAEQLVIGRETAAEVDRLICGMKPDLRAAIVLTSFQNLSPGEAAKVVGCSADTFYWRLSKARKQLRENLADWMES